MAARELTNGDADVGKRLEKCVDDTQATAGSFTPDGGGVLLGDERGNLCSWLFPEPGDGVGSLLARRQAHSSAIRTVAVGHAGKQAATRDESGTVWVWSIAPLQSVISFRTRSHCVRTSRVGREKGMDIRGRAERDRGNLLLFSRGSVTYRKSRIRQRRWLGGSLIERGVSDGPQSGVDALVWAGETAAQTLPVDAFSESYFEPGLLAKLGEDAPRFLNEQPRRPVGGRIYPAASHVDRSGGQSGRERSGRIHG